MVQARSDDCFPKHFILSTMRKTGFTENYKIPQQYHANARRGDLKANWHCLSKRWVVSLYYDTEIFERERYGRGRLLGSEGECLRMTDDEEWWSQRRVL